VTKPVSFNSASWFFLKCVCGANLLRFSRSGVGGLP
jgi:hypothetical protein